LKQTKRRAYRLQNDNRTNAMSSHRAKRAFAGAAADPAQRRITSFFDASSADPSCQPTPSSLSAAHAQLAPHTQAQLINVGMRVRKAVQDGHRTGASTAFSLKGSSFACQPMTDTHHQPVQPAQPPPVRELVPFCGIHRVGGLDELQPHKLQQQQEMLPAARYPVAGWDIMNEFEPPSLTTSQETATTNDDWEELAGASVIVNQRKRGLAADEGEDGTGEGKAAALSAWSAVGNIGARPIALPRKNWRRTQSLLQQAQAQAALAAPVAKGVVHESVMVVDGDFQDAEFLDYDMEMSEA
jgi:hypothetical protein